MNLKKVLNSVLFGLITVLMQSLTFCKHVERVPKIAIVGAGIGGTSTAYFLRELFGSNGASIDIYEGGKVGGRLATTKIGDKSYETGGSVIHPRNRYMVDFMSLFDLEKNTGKSSPVALYDGDEFIFRSSENYLVTIMKMLWRYGFSPMKLDSFIEKTLTEFDSIYDLQKQGESYETVTELLSAMSPSFVDALTNTTAEALERDHMSELLIHELVQAALRVNYGQNISVHAFVGSVSLAGIADDLFSIKGGNKQVPRNLLKTSNANLIPGRVRSVTLNREFETGTYLLNYTVENTEIPVTVEKATFYDIVILATPLTNDQKQRIEFKKFEKTFSFNGNYHRTVCTIVQGDLNYTYFNLNEHEVVPDIISINENTFFNSVNQIKNVHREKSDRKVWKIFSQKQLTENQISLLFTDVKFKTVFDWLAYPDYGTCMRNDTFVLHDYMYHLNAIEWAASAMEMSAIGAKNVALLAYQAWTGNKLPSSSIDGGEEEVPIKKRKIEL